MSNRINVWIKKARKELEKEFGGRCMRCNATSKLEFAHIRPTLVNGKGRGRKERYYDIIKHRENYILLCKPCHTVFDK